MPVRARDLYALIEPLVLPAGWGISRSLSLIPSAGRGFRVSGSARVGRAPRVWSLILKVLPGTPASPTKWNYPAREALAHERGLLEDLPPGAAVLWLCRARRPA